MKKGTISLLYTSITGEEHSKIYLKVPEPAEMGKPSYSKDESRIIINHSIFKYITFIYKDSLFNNN